MLERSWQGSHCGAMMVLLSGNPLLEFAVHLPSGAWGKLFTGMCLTGGTPLQNRLRGMAGAAAGHHVLIPEGCSWHRTSCLCFRSLSLESSWALQGLSAGEAVCASGVRCWRSRVYGRSWVLEKPFIPQQPGTREATHVARAW